MKTEPAYDIMIMSYSGFFKKGTPLCQIKKETIKEEYSEQENANGRTADTNIVTEISKANPEAFTAGSW